MTIRMLRRCMTAVAAVIALAPALSAEAGKGQSPFAGSYAWGSWPVAITDNGQIRGAFDDGGTKVSINGRVGADGTYTFAVDVTELNPEWGPRDKRRWIRTSYEFAGTLAFNADGDIVGTPGSGGSFVWVRQ